MKAIEEQKELIEQLKKQETSIAGSFDSSDRSEQSVNNSQTTNDTS
jgi:hypothetical protein